MTPMKDSSVCIIDGDINYAESLADKLKSRFFEQVQICPDLQSYSDMRDRADIVVVNRSRRDYDLLEFIRKLKLVHPESQVIVHDEDDDLRFAVEAMRRGAYDFVAKNEQGTEKLLNEINEITHFQGLIKESGRLRQFRNNALQVAVVIAIVVLLIALI